MKTGITVDEILELDEGGRDALRDLWIPQKYDRAVYLACTDVENDVYVPMEFVIGQVEVEAMNEDKRYVVSAPPGLGLPIPPPPAETDDAARRNRRRC